MVNKYWLELVQIEKQREIEAKLKSGEVIVRKGKIVLNDAWIKKQFWLQKKESLRKKQQALREEQEWQAEQERIEKCLAELLNPPKYGSN